MGSTATTVRGGIARRALPRTSLPWSWLLVASWVVQVAIRLVFAAHQTTPVLIPDESGYLLGARLLSGGAAADLSGRTFYQAGYSLLIAPAFWTSTAAVTVYHVVLAVNAVLSAALMPLAYLAVRRFGMPRRHAYVLANAAALLPSVLYYTQFALSDVVLPVVVLGWLLLVHSWLTHGRWAAGAGASLLAAYAGTVHPRGLVLVALQAVLVAVILLRRWASGAVVAGSVLAAGTLAGWALNAWVRARIYPDGALPLGAWFLHRVSGLSGLGWTSALATGQLWYMIVSTFGLAGVGLLALGTVMVRRDVPRPTRVTAALTLATVAGVALVTSAAVPDEDTVANFAYGRYLCCLSPVLFLAGMVYLCRVGRVRATRAVLVTAALSGGCALVVKLHAGERLAHDYFGPFDFPEICALTGNWDYLRLRAATAAALAVLSLVVLAAIGYRRRGTLAAAAVLIAVELTVAAIFTTKVSRYWTGQLRAATTVPGLRAQDQVGMAYLGLPWRIWVSQAFQARNGIRPIDRDGRSPLPGDVTVVVVPWDVRLPPRSSWPAAPANWRLVTANPSYLGAWAAWRRTR